MAHRTLALFAASALALALNACNDQDTRARTDAAGPAALSGLAVVDDLPAAEPAPVRDYAPARGYRLAERAYGLQQAVYDAPPDYGFAYDDEESYVWETADDWAMYAEPWDDGYRYYYYAPDAAYPYFVRDRNYGYGYDTGGVLVAVFDSGGRYLPRDYAYRVAPTAGRYYARGHELWRARRGAPRVEVTEQSWAAQAPRVVRTADPWLRAGREQPEWRAWRDRDHARELRRFAGEQRQRQASAEDWVTRTAVDRGRPQVDNREDRRLFERRSAALQDRAQRQQQQQVQAERQAALEQRRVGEQARARDDHQRQGLEQARGQQAEQARAQAERSQRQQAQQAERRQAGQQMAERQHAEHQARAQAERAQQQADHQARQAQGAERRQVQQQMAERQRAEHQARAQAEHGQQQQQQAERQARQQQAQRAEHEARGQAQQQAASQQARQQQQHQAQEARQAQAAQARSAEQQGGRPAAAREGKPERSHGKDRKD